MTLSKFAALIILPVLIFSSVLSDAQTTNEEENLNVFQQWVKWNNPGSLLLNHLREQAQVHYDRRDSQIAVLKTKEDWLTRQNHVRQKLKQVMGEFPAKTPLKARTMSVIKKNGYRIEKIVYEAFPGSYVTGCVFVPEKLNGRAPAILNVMGHDQEGFRTELYQIIIVNLVKKGMIVLAIDPPGQGEHVQYYDAANGFSTIGYTVVEHCYFGNQNFLAGISPAKYFIHEGIRGIDYLVSRKDVDASRIGVTGFSGGGTVTSYLSAFDDRVKVSIPCSWSTATERQLETKAAQDAETIFVNGLENGITFEDLIEVRAPKPTLMSFVSRDQYLSIQGAREAFREAKPAYKLLGKEDNLEFVEDDSKHWMTPKIRLAIYAFFLKHFNLPGESIEEKVDILSEKELLVTSTGQISTSLGGDMIFDINKREAGKLINRLQSARQDFEKHLQTVNVKAKQLSGFIQPVSGPPSAFFNGRYQREGYTVSKIAIPGEGNYVIPILLFEPNEKLSKHPAVIYLHEKGKAVEAKEGGEIEKLVKAGYIVAAADVLGIGETKHTATRELAVGYTGVLSGRSVVGIQAADIVRVTNYLKVHNDVESSKIGAAAFGKTCIPLMHAASFERSIDNVLLTDALISYESVVMNRIYKIGVNNVENARKDHPYEVEFSWGVAGALTGYDLPDLLASIAPRKLMLVNVRNQLLEPADNSLIDEQSRFPKSVYAAKQSAGKIRIEESYGDIVAAAAWLFE